MTTPTSKDLLGGVAGAVKFESFGDAVEGTIERWDVQPVTKMGTGEIDTFPNGNPKYQIITTLQTTLREDDDDDGQRTLYIKSFMMNAVKQALVAAGAEDFEKGGWLRVIFTSMGEAKRGMNAPKMYSAEYRRPSAQVLAGATANVAAGLGGQPVQAQPVYQQQPQYVPQPPQPASVGAPVPTQTVSSGPTPAQIAAVQAAGLDPNVVFAGQL